ncbi:MAG: hypothetical protein N2050_03490 [Flavobacteriales bacterium]|nr:hypothetical protein [Flavobacteriales bacterium]
MAVLHFGCKGGYKNEDLPEGIVFDDFSRDGGDSLWYPSWVYCTAGNFFPDNPQGLSGALDQDSATAWLTEPGCAEGAVFLLEFDSLPAAAAQIFLGRSLWLSQPDSLFFSWNDAPWCPVGPDGRASGKPPLRRLALRLGRVPHWNNYRFFTQADSASTTLISDWRTGFLYNSRPAGVAALIFRDADGKPLRVRAPHSVGFSLSRLGGRDVSWLSSAWSDGLPDLPEVPGKDSIGQDFVITLERPVTLLGLRVLPRPPSELSVPLWMAPAGSGLSGLTPLRRQASSSNSFSLPRAVRGRQFILRRASEAWFPAHVILISDEGPLWLRPLKEGPAHENLNDSIPTGKAPVLKPWLNVPMQSIQTQETYAHSLRQAFSRTASAQDSLPMLSVTRVGRLLLLQDSRIYLTIQVYEKARNSAWVQKSYESWYGRWEEAALREKDKDVECRLSVRWLVRNNNPERWTWEQNLQTPLRTQIVVGKKSMRLEMPPFEILFPEWAQSNP